MEILVVILLVLFVILAGWLVVIELRHQRLANSLRVLMSGRGGVDLETTLLDYVARMDRVEQSAQTVENHLRDLESKLPYVVQHVGIIRFNPFSDKGGDQSFVVALLDDHADGIVFSALHSRNDVRVYGKPVVGGQSTYTLTAEEKDAIARAMKPRA
ncbi:MAG: DUF4446 family protein [Chloroflexi bacterium]|nr:DUF4446 family protein [Chloroflexota bacterium]